MNLISFKFKIVNNRIKLIYSLIFILLGTGILIPSINMFKIKKIDPQVFLLFIVASVIMYCIAIFYSYNLLSFKFEFKNNVFVYKKAFAKKQRCVLSELAQVDITRFYANDDGKYMVVFWNKDDNMIMRFYDNGYIVENRKFNKSLELANIPVAIRK
ncbi:MAG: hypothetical protein K6G28_04545 [Acholeplasmatales bacterium]|nr:hypothetical protein [Acholeplasmatales bacterium]